MGKAGQALGQTLEKHGISQYRLAEVMGIERNNISRWVREGRDPTSENVDLIASSLKIIKPEAAHDFVIFYLGKYLEDRE